MYVSAITVACINKIVGKCFAKKGLVILNHAIQGTVENSECIF